MDHLLAFFASPAGGKVNNIRAVERMRQFHSGQRKARVASAARLIRKVPRLSILMAIDLLWIVSLLQQTTNMALLPLVQENLTNCYTCQFPKKETKI
jgi:hypothetical protein